MAKKKIHLTEKAQNFFDITINGEQVRVNAGDYVLTDPLGNVTVVDEATYDSEYGETEPEDEVTKTPDKKKGKSKSASKDETPVEPAPEAVVETVNDEPVFNDAELAPVTVGNTEGDVDGRD